MEDMKIQDLNLIIQEEEKIEDKLTEKLITS